MSPSAFPDPSPGACPPASPSSSGGDAPPAPQPGAAASEGAESPQDAPVLERRARPERRGSERRVAALPVPVERRKGGDRRQQSDRRDQGKRGGEYDLDADTLEFIAAVNRFKEATGKTFPTWSDLLGIVRDLGYEKRNDL